MFIFCILFFVFDISFVYSNGCSSSKLPEGEEYESLYGPLSSLAYDLLFPEDACYDDAEFFRFYIKQCNGFALEIGSGNGRLLIPYRQEDLKVEGLDTSPSMIEKCMERANKLGLTVTIHNQRMQDIHLSKVYDLIYIPYGSFMLIKDEEESKKTLVKFYNHLSRNGKLIITFCTPLDNDVPYSENVWLPRGKGSYSVEDMQLLCWEKETFSLVRKESKIIYLYELYKNQILVKRTYESLFLKWYDTEKFIRMLNEANFKEVEVINDNRSDSKFHNIVFIAS